MKMAAALLLFFAAIPAHALTDFQIQAVDVGERMSGNYRVAGANDFDFKDPESGGLLSTRPVAAHFAGKNIKIQMGVNGRLTVQGPGIDVSRNSQAMLFDKEETIYGVETQKPWTGWGKPFEVFRCETLRKVWDGFLSIQDLCAGRRERGQIYTRQLSENWIRYEFRYLSIKLDAADGSLRLQYVDQESQTAVELNLTRL